MTTLNVEKRTPSIREIYTARGEGYVLANLYDDNKFRSARWDKKAEIIKKAIGELSEEERSTQIGYLVEDLKRIGKEKYRVNTRIQKAENTKTRERIDGLIGYLENNRQAAPQTVYSNLENAVDPLLEERKARFFEERARVRAAPEYQAERRRIELERRRIYQEIETENLRSKLNGFLTSPKITRAEKAYSVFANFAYPVVKLAYNVASEWPIDLDRFNHKVKKAVGFNLPGNDLLYKSVTAISNLTKKAMRSLGRTTLSTSDNPISSRRAKMAKNRELITI